MDVFIKYSSEHIERRFQKHFLALLLATRPLFTKKLWKKLIRSCSIIYFLSLNWFSNLQWKWCCLHYYLHYSYVKHNTLNISLLIFSGGKLPSFVLLFCGFNTSPTRITSSFSTHLKFFLCLQRIILSLTKSNTHECVSGGEKCSFFRRFGVLAFMKHPFWDFPFFLITDELTITPKE